VAFLRCRWGSSPEGQVARAAPASSSRQEDEGGVLASSAPLERSALTALEELHRWAEALRPLRG
jgi:hypothetical protein